MKLRLLATMSSLACSSITISAQAAETSEIIITASRMAETANETLAPVTVISREDIEQSQSHSLQDLLRGELGLNIANNGGEGKSTSFFLRGTESDHVLVLIDGIKVGSATTGSAPFQNIPIEQIERIEIVRGPRSSLYGSEAIGGVIQIFTRKGASKFSHSLSAGYGSNATSSLSVSTSGNTGNAWFSIGLNGNKTEGFNSCNGPLNAGCRTIEPDDDGHESLSANIHAGYRFANGLEIEAHSLATNANSEYDGKSRNESEVENRVSGTTLRFSPLASWTTALTLGQSDDKSDALLNGAFYSRFATKRTTASLQNDIAITANQLLTVGTDYQNDEVESTAAYAITKRHNNALFGQWLHHFNHHDLQLSLRHDDNEQFGSHNTGSLAWGFDWNNDLRLIAAYGTGFKAPTFNELYYPGYGSDQLKPEESKNIEIGLKGNVELGQYSLNLFENKIDQLIAYDASIHAPGNISLARIRGLEAGLFTELSGWSIDTFITLLDPEHRGNDSKNGNVLPRRAKETLRVDINRNIGLLKAGITLVAHSERYDDLANTLRLPGYATIDLTSSYQLNQDWKLSARIENALDKTYQTAAYYNQPDRGVFLSIHYQPKQ